MKRTRGELDAEIRRTFESVFATHGSGNHAPEIEEGTVLLETGLDSLGYAIVVTRLEEVLGYDPFSLSAEAYYPVTYGEFLDFYQVNQPG